MTYETSEQQYNELKSFCDCKSAVLQPVRKRVGLDPVCACRTKFIPLFATKHLVPRSTAFSSVQCAASLSPRKTLL